MGEINIPEDPQLRLSMEEVHDYTPASSENMNGWFGQFLENDAALAENLKENQKNSTQIIWGSDGTEIADNEVLFVLDDGTGGGIEPGGDDEAGEGGGGCDCSVLTEEEIDEATQ